MRVPGGHETSPMFLMRQILVKRVCGAICAGEGGGGGEGEGEARGMGEGEGGS